MQPQQEPEGGFGARPAPPVSVPNPAFAPGSTSPARTDSVVVMGSNQQSYAVPMEGGGEGTGVLGSSAGSLQDDADCRVPSIVQADAYELMQVPGACEHRSSAPIYSPPEPPPPGSPGWVAAGGGDYTYIDEDAPDDGNSRAAIEYATAVEYTPEAEYLEPAVVGADYEYGSVLTTSSAAGGSGDNDMEYVEPNAIDDDAPDDGYSRAAIEYVTVVDGAQLDRDGYVEKGELPSGPAVYAEPVARGSGGGGGAPASRVLLDSGGTVAGGDLPGSSVYETANSTV